MHVLYFHQHFSTRGGSTGTRSLEMAKHLIERGHTVTMVCGSYGLADTGLKGETERGVRTGSVEGIQVIEIDLPYSNYDSLLRRSMIFVRFAIKSIGIAWRTDYDVLFATSTPLLAGLPGIAMRLLKPSRPFVFEVRDLWPELPRAMGVVRNPVVLGALSLLEWLCYASASACIGLSPGIVEGIRRRTSRRKPIAMIPNGCDLDLFAARPRGRRTSRIRAVFTGAHGMANGLDAVLDAAAVLKARGRGDIEITFIGDGKLKPELARRAQAEELDNCTFADPLPKSRLADALREADIGMMILADVPAFYYGTSPNKFFDYIASGLPVVNNYPGWLADLIAANGCGIAVPPRHPEALADALVRLADSRRERHAMGANARRLAEATFGREQLARRFADFLEAAGRRRRPSAVSALAKRTVDIALSLAALILLSPVGLVTALLVRTRLGRPVLFRQERPGQNAHPFHLLKFRTMTDARGPDGKPLPDDQRLTRLGRFLRTTSLDELPELINVLRGEMSLVGPRPLLMEYLPRYNAEQARRHDVKPGITGWAQVNGRNAISWEEKFRLDVWYVDHRTLGLDAKILFRTVWCVVARKGISAEGSATMPVFMGTHDGSPPTSGNSA